MRSETLPTQRNSASDTMEFDSFWDAQRAKYAFVWLLFFFFFQAEDGIRDLIVTGVQTCALPISRPDTRFVFGLRDIMDDPERIREQWRELGVYDALEHLYDGIAVYGSPALHEIGRASCRERV